MLGEDVEEEKRKEEVPSHVVQFFQDIDVLDDRVRQLTSRVRSRSSRTTLPWDAESRLRAHVDAVNRLIMYIRRVD